MSISSRIPYSPCFHQLDTQISNSNTVKVPSLSSSSPTNSSSLIPLQYQEYLPKGPIFLLRHLLLRFLFNPWKSCHLSYRKSSIFSGVFKNQKPKYEQLLFYGRNMNPLESQYKTSNNKVKGCVSQVWVRAYLADDKSVIFEADSDSVLTKGLAALLVQGLSGWPVDEIVRVSPDFVVLLGLQQSLTPSQNNGFLNMLKLMQKKALRLYVEAEKIGNMTGDEFGEGPVENSNLELNDGGGDDGSTSGETFTGININSNSGNVSLLGNRGVRIEEMLEKELRPLELKVEDISYQHAGHSGFRGSDAETHFNVKVVSEEFEGKSLVKRHKLIYNLLQDELKGGLHALSIVANTPAEVGTQ